jgi:hypothetical protein
MDVLKEIARAESRAREIDLEFSKKTEALAESARERLALSRADAEKALEAELAALRAELASSHAAEKKKVSEAARASQEKLERQARENVSRATAIILERIGL